MSSGVSFDSEKFIQAKIMELMDPNNPNDFRFTTEFERAVEDKLLDNADIKNAFRNIALTYGTRSGTNLTEIEIEYATDLYLGINPWTKTSYGIR